MYSCVVAPQRCREEAEEVGLAVVGLGIAEVDLEEGVAVEEGAEGVVVSAVAGVAEEEVGR